MKFILFIFLLYIGVSRLYGEDLKTWSNQKGETIVASIIGVLGDSVYFQTRLGKQFRYPIAALAASDQATVGQWKPTQANSGATGVGIPLQQSKIAKLVQGKLVHPGERNGTFIPAGFEAGSTPKFYAFYYSAHWCGPCRQFTPQLVRFYERMKGSGTQFEVIFVSADRSKNQMYQYMKEDRMKFPAVEYSQGRGSYEIMKYSGSGIPCLVFMDHTGKVLSDSYVRGQYVGPRKVLADMERILKQDTGTKG